MTARQTSRQHITHSRRPPAKTPEQREHQLIAKAVDLAEKQLEDGTASAQVITHYLKLGSSRERLEQERLAMEVQFMEAKKETMASQARTEELMKDALNAFRSYSGASIEEDDGYDD